MLGQKLLDYYQELLSNCESKKLEFFNVSLDKPKRDMIPTVFGLDGSAQQSFSILVTPRMFKDNDISCFFLTLEKFYAGGKYDGSA
jgi:hypothetical protein